MISVFLSKLAQIVDKNELNIPTNPNPEGSLSNIITLVFVIAGGTAVIILIIAGIKYMTSRGEPEKVAAAKNTIIYAAIGLILLALATSLVRFVARKAG